jgi:S-DNA-T family DNA segregation ATPase FtsK/SpoIIIE
MFWPGPVAPPVRMLPTQLPVAQLPVPERPLRFCLGLDEQRLGPVWHDFMATPHLLVMGDNETGKTNMLRLILRSITQRYGPDEAKVVIGDSRRDLDNAIPAEYRVGYAVTSEDLGTLAAQTAISMNKRIPGQDVTSDRLRKRDWWSGPELFVVVDDYELLGKSMGSVLDPLMPLMAQGAYIGMHVIIARSVSGAMRAMMDPVLRRLWEVGNPGVLLSYPKEEGKFLGEAKPAKLPPGRAQLVTRRSVQLIQTGMVTAGMPAEVNA